MELISEVKVPFPQMFTTKNHVHDSVMVFSFQKENAGDKKSLLRPNTSSSVKKVLHVIQPIRVLLAYFDLIAGHNQFPAERLEVSLASRLQTMSLVVSSFSVMLYPLKSLH